MRLVFANEATAARRRVYFHLTDATDGITAETGEAAGQPQVSSDGAAFTNTGIGTLSHLGNGRYSADLTQTLVATAGVSIETRYKSAATAETPGDSVQVVAFNPYSTSLDILLAAANLSTDTITAAKIATDAITAAKIANNAITDQKISTSAVDKIVDQVWDEVLSGHLTAGTTGAALNGASAPTAAAVADAVWDELLADHVTAATMGANQNLIDNINSDTDDIQTRLPAALVSGRMDASVGAMAAGVVTAAAIATDAIDADAIADNAINAGAIATGAITAAKFAAGAIDAAAIASDAITASKIATDAITAAKIATDAIGAAEISAAAVDKIVDGVWDELISVHLSAGSTGEALNAAVGIPLLGTADSGTTTTMVDSARTEADTDYWKGSWIHFTSGTILGQARLITGFNPATDTITFVPATTQAVATNTYRIIPAGAVDLRLWNGTAQNDLIGGRVDASVGAMAAGVVTATAIATDAIDADALAASALAEINAEVDTALADIRLDEVILNAASPVTPTIDSFWDRITSKNGSQTFDRLTDSLEAIADSGSTPPSAATIADAVWDELLADHVTAATMGANQNLIDNINADTDDIQTRLPAALVSGRMDSSVGAMAADVLTAAAIATDAIGSAELAASAVNEIADQVWDELIAGHLGAGSTGEALNNAAAGGSPAAIADAVWDELRAGHVGAGSFGEGVASVQGNVTGSVASVTGNVGGNVVGSVGSVAAGGITAASIATDAIDADALAASALAEINTEIDTALADIRLDELIQNAAAPATPTINSFIDRMTSKDGTQTYDRSTDSLEGIRDALAAAGPSAATIADAVWDEALADHVAVGSMGFNENLIDDVFADTNDIQTRLPAALVGGRMDSSVGAMAAGVVTAAAVATGAIDADALATDAVNEIVDQVWEEQLGDHSGTVGSTAEALDAAASGGSAPSAAVIADAVWDEALAGHVLAGSTGEAQNMIDDILTDTAAIQPLVDVAVSTRATPAQVNTEVDTALADIRLDELIQNVAAPITPTIDSFIDRITSKNGAQTYDRSTDSLEAASDAIVAAGPSAAIIADAVWDEVLAGHLTAGSTGAALDAIGDDLDLLMGPGFNAATDSLEEIRDEVDACCGVGGGGDEVDVEAG